MRWASKKLIAAQQQQIRTQIFDAANNSVGETDISASKPDANARVPDRQRQQVAKQKPHHGLKNRIEMKKKQRIFEN